MKLVWQSPKQLNRLFFESYHIKDHNRIQEARKKTPATRVIPIRLPKLSTDTAKVTAEQNQYMNSPVSIKTVRRKLNKTIFHGRSAIRKRLLSNINIQKRLKWCIDHKSWSADHYKQVIFSDESSFFSFPNCRVSYVWRQPIEATTLAAFFPQ